MGKEIKKGSKVSVHFIGKFEDGEIFDSSYDTEPLDFEVGTGDIVKGFEDGIMGMKAGEKKSFPVSCEDGYGLFDDELVIEVPKEEIPEGEEIKPGVVIFLEGEDGEEYDFVVQEVKDDVYVLDGNHPLAGEDLFFEVEVLSVK
ncbi:MAG: FKBP-type peptidyl-prolyl cis-trans isomerase [Bacteroidota bacterium]